MSQHIHFPRNKKYVGFLENEIVLWIWKYFSIFICINCQTNVKEFKQYFVRAGTALSEFMYVLKIFTCYKWGASFLVSVLVCFLRSLRTSSMKTLYLAVLTLLFFFMFLLIVLKVFALNRDYCNTFVILASNTHNSVYSLRFWHCQSTSVHLYGLCCVNSYLERYCLSLIIIVVIVLRRFISSLKIRRPDYLSWDYNGVTIHTQLGASCTIIKIFPKWYKPFNIICYLWIKKPNNSFERLELDGCLQP